MSDHHPENALFLPQEVWENIIDYSDNLLSCALTCKSWTQRSQRNIFRCIGVRNVDALKQLLGTLAVNPVFGGYINSINLPIQQVFRFWPEYLGRRKNIQTPHVPELAASWPFSILVELVPYLTDLEHLSISGVVHSRGAYLIPTYIRISIATHSEPSSKLFIDAVSRTSESIRTLDLSLVQFPSLEDLTKFILMFPRLRTLRLVQVKVLSLDQTKADHTPTSVVTSTSLEHFTLLRSQISLGANICRWIVLSQLHTQLSTLELDHVNCSPTSSFAPTVGEIIRSCGPRLHKLDLEIHNVLKLSRDGVFSLKTNTSLQVLSIKQKCYGLRDHRRTKRLHWLVGILSSLLENDQLRELCIEVNMPSNPHDTADASLMMGSKLVNDFLQLDSLFMSLESIRMIQFWITVAECTFDDDGSIVGDISQASKIFPMSMARGNLDFRATPRMYEHDDGMPEPDSDNDI